MLTCRQFTQRITDYREGHSSWRQRLEARVHLLSCPHCRALVGQDRMTSETFRRATRAQARELTPAQHSALMAQFRNAYPSGGGTPRPSWVVRSLARADRFARKSGWLVPAVVAFVAALVLWLSGKPLLPLGPGVRCLVMELGVAGLASGAVMAAALPNRVRLSRTTWMLCATTGGLLGASILHFKCPMGDALHHISVMHLGGVLCAGALGLLLARPNTAS